MNTEQIQTRFQEMGARVKFGTRNPPNRQNSPISIDIQRDHKGEYFQINTFGDQQIEVENIDSKDRHLLLLHRNERMQGARKVLELSKFLCGHDETHWFVAAIPESARGVTNVITAKQALKPREILEAEKRVGLTTHKKEAHKHRNDARRRQGEWFFIPTNREFKEIEIMKNEPIRRGRGKPHMCEELVRFGGETVMTSNSYADGITMTEYNKIMINPDNRRQVWRRMTRNMKVFVRGRITHPDHRTIILRQWNEVIPNEETKSRAMSSVVFLD